MLIYNLWDVDARTFVLFSIQLYACQMLRKKEIKRESPEAFSPVRLVLFRLSIIKRLIDTFVVFRSTTNVLWL